MHSCTDKEKTEVMERHCHVGKKKTCMRHLGPTAEIDRGYAGQKAREFAAAGLGQGQALVKAEQRSGAPVTSEEVDGTFFKFRERERNRFLSEKAV